MGYLSGREVGETGKSIQTSTPYKIVLFNKRHQLASSARNLTNKALIFNAKLMVVTLRPFTSGIVYTCRVCSLSSVKFSNVIFCDNFNNKIYLLYVFRYSCFIIIHKHFKKTCYQRCFRYFLAEIGLKEIIIF